MAKIRLTEDRVAKHKCDKPGQSKYLWDSELAGLGLRAIGKQKYYIIQTRLDGKVVQLKMGDVSKYPLVSDARTEAYELLAMIRKGIDPREVKRQLLDDQAAAKETRLQEEALQKAQGATVDEVWQLYLGERRPHWGDRHHLDHLKLSQDGSVERRKGKGQRKPGPLAPLMPLHLSDLTPERLEMWISKEVADRPTQSALAMRLLRSFLSWCGEQPEYQQAVNATAITSKVKSSLPKKTANTDCLQKEQLAGWFDAVRQIQNPVISSYLQALLLTGARKEELAGLRWEDIDFRWKSITIRDKVDGMRVIPLPPFCESLLKWLPHRNQWVFSSPKASTGRLQEPFKAHQRALAVAGIDHLSLHGLRRSFGSLSEWVELPVGIVAQIMGHKPSATAEKHYRVRPLDLLRMWHTKFEVWILEQAGITLPEQKAAEPLLAVVNGSGK